MNYNTNTGNQDMDLFNLIIAYQRLHHSLFVIIRDSALSEPINAS